MVTFVKLPTPVGHVRINPERVTHILETDDIDQCIVSFGLTSDGVIIDLRPADAMAALMDGDED